MGVDYRDRWRVDPATGYPRLTLRRIFALTVRWMRPGGAVERAVAGFTPMPRSEQLLDDIRRTVLLVNQKKGSPLPEPHPDRNRQVAEAPSVTEQRAAIQRERQAARGRGV